MNIRDALRTAILATNPYWPFSVANKYPYYLAIKAFTRFCSIHREVKSVYLRSGLVERAWVPAISDIDFTVIIDGNLGRAAEFEFLQKFWRQFGSLKNFFPMIGETDILTDRYLGSWTRFGFPGYASRNWRLVYGNETVLPSDSYDLHGLWRDRMHYALHWMQWYCRSYFAQRFFAREEASPLLLEDLRRLAGKILRSLGIASAAATDNLRAESEHELCARVLVSMEQETRKVETADYGSAAENEVAEWTGQFPLELRPKIAGQEFVDAEIFASWSEAVESVILDFNNQLFLVFRNDLEVATLATCLRALQQELAGAKGFVMAVSRSAFAYLLRFYQPFEYVHLMRHRRIVFGEDPMPQIAPPTRSAIARFLLGQAPNVLAFPQSLGFHFDMNLNELTSLVQRGLFLQLYLEHHFIAPSEDQFWSECERFYAEQILALRGYRERGIPPMRHAAFETLKALSDRVHALLACSRN